MFFEHHMMDKVQKPSYPKFCAPSSEPFRTDLKAASYISSKDHTGYDKHHLRQPLYALSGTCQILPSSTEIFFALQ
jgi:hypothetical protein